MKAKIKIYLLILALAPLAWSCKEEALDPKSIFETEQQAQNDFDKWLFANYTTPYNIKFNYRWDDKEITTAYNLVPAKYENSVALAKMIKHLWIDAYGELKGEQFLKTYGPKMFQLVGSKQYTGSGSVVLGTAEGGLKVTLFNVNDIDIENPDLEMLNYWYFKTMHHEFAHILHQKKSFTTDFNLISAKDYQSGSWVNVADTSALKMGFISPYGSSEPQEDFVEMVAVYVTKTQKQWDDLLNNVNAKDTTGLQESKTKLLQKFSIVKDYMQTTWDIDITKLREIVLKREAEVPTMDWKSLN